MKASPTNGHSKSIINRLKGPFFPKQYPQIKQEIQPDLPLYHTYTPGDSIKGKVILDVPKPVRATHLVVRLHGFVKVVRRSRLPGEAIPYDESLLNSTVGRKAGEYFGNGFAKLFEDEQVLCGDGRLHGHYEFTFEVILPTRNMPSSIEFENGIITYSLTSTLTKPTTISPTLVEHCKLQVRENIDIARTAKPRPQTVSLETVKSRRPVRHVDGQLSSSSMGRETVMGQPELRSSHILDGLPASEIPRSPGFSDIGSVASVESSSTSNTRSGANVPTGTDGRSTSSGLFSLNGTDKTITAQTEILQGGCLPGDTINIRVSVDHTKPIKSMQGILITFYRSALIDTHPAIPLGPSNGSDNARYEDYYPRSRTGLGGLSLSSAGSSRLFRQDLAQNMAPLIVDPTTLTAVLNTKIHIPEHIFPTISGVPGSMISFKYFIEIVIDLRGKLGQDRLADKLSLTNMPQHYYEDPKINVVNRENGVTFSSTPGFNFLMTNQILRQKGVVFTKTEILVGTRDSSRSIAKSKNREPISVQEPHAGPPQKTNGNLPRYYSEENFFHDGEIAHYESYGTSETHRRQPTVAPPVPLEEPSSEKERMRRAEMTLLPSAPLAEGTTSSLPHQDPSAPHALDEDDFQNRYRLRAPAPRYEDVSSGPMSGASGPALGTENTYTEQTETSSRRS